MKNFIKNNLKVFVSIIVTTIIVGSVSVYAAGQYFAKDISFTPKNENFKKENGEPIDNVEDALNELYNKNNNIEFIAGKQVGNNMDEYEYTVEKNGKIVVTLYACRGTNGYDSITNYYCKKNNTELTASYVYDLAAPHYRMSTYIVDVKVGDIIKCRATATGAYADSGYSIVFVN